MGKKVQKSAEITKSAHVRGLEIEYTPHADFAGITKKLFSSEKGVTIDTLYEVVKHSPEVAAALLAKVEDFMADYWRFSSNTISGKQGKTAINKAKAFESKVGYYGHLTDGLFDMFATGNGFILKLSIDEEKLKSLMVDLTKNLAKSFNVKVKKGEIYKLIKQETKAPKDLQVLKASTVKINFDKTGLISSYEQEVKGERRVYDPKDIIHLHLVRIGGQPYGFSRLEPLLSDIGTLIFAKEFAGKYFENDGVPYFIFSMPDESPGGRNYKLLKRELKSLKKKGEKYRSMVLTGNVGHEQVNKFNKDMEFAKLIEHFTQIIFVGLGVPAHRVHYALAQKGDATAKEAGKRESGYYKGLSFEQKLVENILNRDLWSLFGVKKTFKRSYKSDEIREAEIIRILSEIGAITVEEAREKIGMEPELPKGTMARSIGSDRGINEGKDGKREQGTDQEPKNRTDNKLKTAKK